MSDVPGKLLRETLRRRMSQSPASGCIDAETLAAWSDGALTARERAAAESHASSCVRCQALLAAMARTAPPAAARQWWRTSTLGWLVPLAAATVAVALAITIPRTRVDRSAPPSVSAATASPSSVSAPPAPSVLSGLPRQQAAGSTDRTADLKDAVTPKRPARVDEQRAAAAGAARTVRTLPEQAKGAANRASDIAAASPRPVEAPSAADASPEITAAQAATSARDVLAPAAPKPFAGPSTRIAAASGARAQALAKTSVVPTEIVSPNPSVRWRILTAGTVERSIDGGTTWQTQSTGVPATLTAGAAPSPTICWLVGPGGSVALSLDGRTWQRVSLSEALDLTSIRAVDGANATVTAADGRTFTTADGGKTWRALP